MREILSYKVLARKWRPKKFSEVIGQDHITLALKNSIIGNKIAHAYLLTGTRGIGKTSIVRIFAKAIRCENRTPQGEPCLVCESCVGIESGHAIDYLEIDGASNNSVENIRDLVESVQYLPTNGQYKVYVIDEVHMLSVSAFNALLKTLEEPPKHVVFLFATTDPQKLLGTVLSRCQRFDFKNASLEILTKHLEKVAKAENIKFAHENIPVEIAKQGRGSVRDTLSLFDQVIAFSHDNLIDEEVLNFSLGLVENKVINQMIDSLFAGDKEKIYHLFQEAIQENINLKMLANQLLDKLYKVIIDIDVKGQSHEDFGLVHLEKLSLVELMWIYENLSKDIDWSLSSLNPESSFCFSLIKMAVREQIVRVNDQRISVKKNSEIVEKETPSHHESLSWKDFIKFLYEHNKSSALNLERGNLLNKSYNLGEQLDFTVAFDQESKIFYDFLNEADRRSALKALLADFLNRSPSELSLTFQLLNETEKKANNFQSSLEIEENKAEAKRADQTEEILNSKYIKEAENLFNSKVSKVILNEGKN